jgi:hypothetical protein
MNKPISVSNSILGRRKELGDAIWTWLWLVDNTTQIRPWPGGLEGLVSNGDKLKPATIAKALGLSVRTVNLHIKVLCEACLVRKMVPGVPSGFELADSVEERTR